MLSRAATVARHEFMTNARRWEFMIVTLGLPLLTVAIFLLASVPSYLYLRSRQLDVAPIRVGIVDASGRLRFPPTYRTDPSAETAGIFHFATYPSAMEGEHALTARAIDFLYVFGPDYADSGRAACVTLRRSPFDVSPRPPMALLLREQLLAGKVDAATRARIRAPLVEASVVVDEKGRRIDNPLTDMVASVALPYAMMALLVLALLGSSNYLLRGLAEDKESRMQEVLLASVQPADLFYGKIAGAGALGLLQVTVWLALWLPVGSRVLTTVNVAPLTLAMFLVYFVLGYLLYAAILAGIGSVGSTEKEASQIFAIFVLILSSPLLFLPILLDAPNGWLPRVFSIFPLTSPSMMIMRAAGGPVPLADVAASVTLLALTVWAAMRLSLRVFRVGLLMYGKPLTLTELWKALRA